MVFVKPSKLVLTCADLIQKFGFVLTATSLAHFGLFFMHPLVSIYFLNQASSPVNLIFDLEPYTRDWDFDPVALKMMFNSILVAGFWLQHSTMARGKFKALMNDITGNLYHFFEKGVY
jgi:hypothetical protein